MIHHLAQLTTTFISDAVFRKLYKVIYKYSHSRSYRHNRNYWPYYQIERSSEGYLSKIRFKSRLVIDNTQLEYGSNQKCMLVATGPSIRNLQNALFQRPDIDYIGVNGAISLDSVDFKHYVIIDYNFTTKRFDLIERVLKSQCNLFTTSRCLDFILRRISPSEIRCQIKIIELIREGEIERFFGPKISVDLSKDHFYEDQSYGFSMHIFDAAFDYFTVSYVALQVAYSLRYRTIYIAGLDMNNFSQPRFYEKTENKQSTMLDHYSSVIFPAFDVAAKVFREKNIKVYNLSPESAVESFEKLSPRPNCLSDI